MYVHSNSSSQLIQWCCAVWMERGYGDVIVMLLCWCFVVLYNVVAFNMLLQCVVWTERRGGGREGMVPACLSSISSALLSVPAPRDASCTCQINPPHPAASAHQLTSCRSIRRQIFKCPQYFDKLNVPALLNWPQGQGWIKNHLTGIFWQIFTSAQGCFPYLPDKPQIHSI